ncbi:MAG: hypothetical protein AABX01_07730 [Candidatus Micrarchaeota archaeon]
MPYFIESATREELFDRPTQMLTIIKLTEKQLDRHARLSELISEMQSAHMTDDRGATLKRLIAEHAKLRNKPRRTIFIDDAQLEKGQTLPKLPKNHISHEHAELELLFREAVKKAGLIPVGQPQIISEKEKHERTGFRLRTISQKFKYHPTIETDLGDRIAAISSIHPIRGIRWNVHVNHDSEGRNLSISATSYYGNSRAINNAAEYLRQITGAKQNR